MRYGIDPMTEDPHVLDEREDEAIRQARWDAFRELTLERVRVHGWSYVTAWLYQSGRKHTPLCDDGSYGWDILQFQETESLSGVLSCLAQARRQWEEDMKKIEAMR